MQHYRFGRGLRRASHVLPRVGLGPPVGGWARSCAAAAGDVEASPVSVEEFDEMMYDCFLETRERRVIRLPGALEAMAPRLVVATSGGPDSTALLMLANAWVRLRGKGVVEAVTFDHGVRPEAGEEADQVHHWCRRRGIPHRVVALDFAAGEGHAALQSGSSPALRESAHLRHLQQRARQARYRALAGLCAESQHSIALLGHTLSDDIETMAMRLFRSSGLAGLAGMQRCMHLASAERAGSAVCWRPLLSVPKARTEATCRAMLQPFVVDPSNRGLAFDRNRTRRALDRAGAGESCPDRELALAPAARAARLPARAVSEHAVRGLARCAAFDPMLNVWHVNLAALRASLGDRAAFNEAWAIVTSTVSGAEYRPPVAALDSLYDSLVLGNAPPPPALHACELLPRATRTGTLTVVRAAKRGGAQWHDLSEAAACVLSRGGDDDLYTGLWLGHFSVRVQDSRPGVEQWEYAVTAATDAVWAAARRRLIARRGHGAQLPRLPAKVRQRLACVVRWRVDDPARGAEVVAVPQARVWLERDTSVSVRAARAVHLRHGWEKLPAVQALRHSVVVGPDHPLDTFDRVVPAAEWDLEV